MAVSKLPKTITKAVLMTKALKRSAHWSKLYKDPAVSAQHMYEDMSCSVFSGCPADDFPDEVKAEQDSFIRYQYEDGNCYFFVDDIEVEVYDLRSMRESTRFNEALYSDICVISIDYKEEDGTFMHHIIPDTWLYGSTSDDFAEGVVVDKSFVDAARKYIKEHNITKEMQEVPD